MNGDALPGRGRALGETGSALGRAALGGAASFAALVAGCQALALAQHLVLGTYGLWSWAKFGLLTALLSVRAEIDATIGGAPFFAAPDRSATFHWRFVLSLLTIGFLWLTARAGRQAARA